MLSFNVSTDRFTIKTLNIKIVNVLLRIGLEKLFLIQQRKCQPLKTLIKSLQEFTTCLSIFPFHIPFKDVSRVICLIILKLISLNPHSSLDKMDPHLLLMLILNRKPYILFSIQLVHKLKQRSPRQQLITDLVLDVCHHLKKLGIVYLRISQNVT